jgi:MFS family permease
MLALAATLAIQALVAMAMLTPSVVAPLAAPEIGVAASQTGSFMGIAYAAACIASLSSGMLLRRFGAMRLSQLCLLACALGIALCSSALLALVALSAVVIGFGYGPVTPASSHILVRQSPSGRRALIFSIKQTGVPVGGVLAGTLVPFLVVWLGWRIAALSVGLLCLALAVAVQPLRRRFDAEEIAAAGGPSSGGSGLVAVLRGGVGVVLGVPPLRRLALSSVAFSATQLCFASFLVTYLITQIGFDLVDAGVMLAIGNGAGIPARILWGWIADRFIAPQRLLAVLGVAMAAATAALGLVTPSWPRAAIVAVALVHGATAIGWNGVYLSEVARLAPAGAAGAATGGALALTFLGIVTGPPIFGAVVAATGSYRIAFGMVAITACLGGLACFGAGRRKRV